MFKVDKEIIIDRDDELNRGKRGRPFKYGNVFFLEAAAYREVTKIKYRQLWLERPGTRPAAASTPRHSRRSTGGPIW